ISACGRAIGGGPLRVVAQDAREQALRMCLPGAGLALVLRSERVTQRCLERLCSLRSVASFAEHVETLVIGLCLRGLVARLLRELAHLGVELERGGRVLALTLDCRERVQHLGSWLYRRCRFEQRPRSRELSARRLERCHGVAQARRARV